MTKCSSCGGTYASLLADGTRYFHACPSLSEPEVIAALGLNVDRSKWTAGDAAAFAAAPRVRANARNENVPDVATMKPLIAAVKTPDPAAYWKQVNALQESTMVAAGAGTTTVP